MSRCIPLFQAMPADHGSWTCMLTLDGVFESVRTYLDLQVSVRPKVSISSDNSGDQIRVVDGETSTARLDLTAGQDRNLTCSAHGGFPRSGFHWSVDTNNSTSSYLSPHSDQPSHMLSPLSYTVTSSYSVTLHPSVSQSNTTLSCLVTQYDSGTGNVIHTNTVS